MAKLTAHQCDNCQQFVLADNLNEIKDYDQRVEDGEVEPTGECPECGCLCHEVDVTLRPRFKVTESDANFGTFHIFGEDREIQGLDGLYETAINDALDLVRKLAAMPYPGEGGTITTSDFAVAKDRLKRFILEARAIPGTVSFKDMPVNLETKES